MTDSRAIIAAHNNADWYAMMFDVHRLKYERSDAAFLALEKPPPFHSWITTTAPSSETMLLNLVLENLQRPGFLIKDAFDCLALDNQGLIEFFSGTWIWNESVPPANTSNWRRVTTAEELLMWEAAWRNNDAPSKARQFPDAILQRDDVFIWGRECGDGFDAGVIANLSADCVGLSNCFGNNAYPAAAAICAAHADKRPVVGYENGDDLIAAQSLGFTTTGTLRLWGKPI